MYIVRNYTALMHLDPTDRINAVLTPIPFDSPPYGYLSRIKWSIANLLHKKNFEIKYQQSSTIHSWYLNANN